MATGSDSSPGNGTSILLACSVFEEEINNLADQYSAFARVEYLPMGLHDQPDKLREQLQQKIDSLEQLPGVETIVLAYALCGNGVLGLRPSRCQLVLPRSDDCIGVFMGAGANRSEFLKDNPRAYFYSPGWVREKRVPGPDREKWIRELYAAKYDEDMVDELVEADADCFKHYNCAAYIQLSENAQARTYCEDCARHLGWQFRELQPDPAFFKKLLTGPWHDDARFLIVKPGQEISTDPHLVLKAVPV